MIKEQNCKFQDVNTFLLKTFNVFLIEGLVVIVPFRAGRPSPVNESQPVTVNGRISDTDRAERFHQ